MGGVNHVPNHHVLMRRVIKIGLLLLVVGLLAWAGFSMKQTLATKEQRTQQIQQRPDFKGIRFVTTSSLNPTAMLNNKPSVIILFDPDCEHCQYEAEQLSKRNREFAHAGVYLLTTQTPVRARAFARHYGLDTLAMMHVGTLSPEESRVAFGPTSMPHLFIYGADGRLRKEFKGETKIETLLKYL